MLLAVSDWPGCSVGCLPLSNGSHSCDCSRDVSKLLFGENFSKSGSRSEMATKRSCQL